MTKHPVRVALAVAACASGATLAVSSVASASTLPRGFLQAQAQLEHQLSSRVEQLAQLSKDVSNAAALTAGDKSTLAARLVASTTSINGLVSQVPSDTTMAELRAARKTMIQGNRVFAVLTPQVFEVIEADAVGVQVTSFQAGEPALQADVRNLIGQPGYKDALVHYDGYVAAVNRAATGASDVSARVLGQLPQDFPRDIHVFVGANRQLLSADIALAHASYDASIVGLASGGYTGS